VIRQSAALVVVTASLVLGCVRPAEQRPREAGSAVVQDRPVIVIVHAEWCAACRHVAPVIAWLRSDYGARVTFVDLDVTDAETAARAAEVAERAGLGPFFAANKESPGITILGRDRKPVRHLTVEGRPGPYRVALDEAFATFTPRPAP
jgi:thiol-disulfide isomerase/thioredoxin